jgi:hypothetical protein
MDKKTIASNAIDSREFIRKAYENSDLKEQITYRDFERAATWPFMSASKTMRDPKMPGYYEFLYLGIFIPKPQLLLKSFFFNRKRKETGELSEGEYKKYQTPIVSLLRRLNINPLNIKLNKTKWRSLSTTKKQLKQGQ